jgi:hypothetical protein
VVVTCKHADEHTERFHLLETWNNLQHALFGSLSNRWHQQRYTARPTVRSRFLSSLCNTISFVFTAQFNQHTIIRGRRAKYVVTRATCSTKATVLLRAHVLLPLPIAVVTKRILTEKQHLTSPRHSLLGWGIHYSIFLQAYKIRNNRKKS